MEDQKRGDGAAGPSGRKPSNPKARKSSGGEKMDVDEAFTVLGEGSRLNLRALQQFLTTVAAHESQMDMQLQSELLARWHTLSVEYELLEKRLLHYADKRNETALRISERQREGLEELEEHEKKPMGELRQKRLKELVSKQCFNVVKALMAHKCSWPFNDPVDTTRFKDYTAIVKDPIDLGTIKKRLEAGTNYELPEQVAVDLRRVFHNAKLYNPPGSDVYLMAMIMEDKMEERWNATVLPKQQEETQLQQQDEVQLRRKKADQVRRAFLQDGHKEADELLQDIVAFQRRLIEASSMAASLCSPLTEEEKKELSVVLASQSLEMRKSLLEEARACAGREAYDLDPNVAQSMDLESLDALELRILQAMTRPRGYNQPIYPAVFKYHGGLEKGAGIQL